MAATAEEFKCWPSPPDLAVYQRESGSAPQPSREAYLFVKLVGSSETYTDVMQAIEVYDNSARRTWVIDPERRTFADYRGGALKRCTELTLPDLNIAIRKDDIFR